MTAEPNGEQKTVVLDRLELKHFGPGTQLRIHLEGSATFLVILTDPEVGKAVVRPWTGGGQANAGTRDVLSIIGTRPFEEGASVRTIPGAQPEDVNWGGLTFGEELALYSEEWGQSRTMYLGAVVDGVSGPPLTSEV